MPYDQRQTLQRNRVNWTGFAVLSAQTGNSAYVCSDITGRPGRIRWKCVGIGCASSVEPRRPLREATGRSSPQASGTCFFAGDTQDWGYQLNLYVSSAKGPAAPLIGRRWHVYGSTMQSLLSSAAGGAADC